MVEVDIHCNVIRCRKPLSVESQACVTSCSRNAHNAASEDIILIQLNPTEEYKSSVLAGLKPEIILDICMRAVAFYEYQTSQEIAFRAMIQKNIQEKYKVLKDQFDIATRDLNHIIKGIMGTGLISAYVVEVNHDIAFWQWRRRRLRDFELEKLKCQQIMAKFDEKNKQFQKLQTMYEKLKRKSINPNLQDAMPSLQQQQPPPSTRPPAPHGMPHHSLGAGSTRLYQTNNYARPLRPQYNNSGPTDDDLVSRLGRVSNITAGRSVFVPPHSPTAQSYHSRLRHEHHRPSRIPSPSIAPDNSLFSYRHHPSRRDSLDCESQMPPTATATADFCHQRQPPQ
ncbi:E3 ubiquitin-protein ligase CCNB1IP1 [Mucor ambiguus]|uniref:E3 ubiquitin-protein ligase CCNB1IP1 n=1 Tax=Mucor ambiguus TaxID=91626 RepID=A0A0C9LUP6_9FUNG|nr:E3 ubiquitin-protein ligase CCNB1IP1 [Mucor ambiguus]